MQIRVIGSMQIRVIGSMQIRVIGSMQIRVIGSMQIRVTVQLCPPLFALNPLFACASRKNNKYQFHGLGFDSIGVRIHDLPNWQ
jgi:hypothetical protein